MVILFIWPVPVISYVTVIVVAVTAMLTILPSGPPVPEILAKAADPTPELNCQPFGALRISVLPEPTGKSPFAVSVMTMFHRAVKAGAAPLAALSADIPVPPVAAVTVESINVACAVSPDVCPVAVNCSVAPNSS